MTMPAVLKVSVCEPLKVQESILTLSNMGCDSMQAKPLFGAVDGVAVLGGDGGAVEEGADAGAVVGAWPPRANAAGIRWFSWLSSWG